MPEKKSTFAEVQEELGRRMRSGDWLDAHHWYREQFEKGLVIMPKTEYREDAPPDLGPKWDRPRI